jgi:hypothetical protein
MIADRNHRETERIAALIRERLSTALEEIDALSALLEDTE